MDQPQDADVERVTRALGEKPVSWRAASGHGAPSNRRWVVTLPAGSTAFVKIAAYDYTAEWLRNEHRNYRELQGSPHVPGLLGWDDDGIHPALAIEDLSSASWPPPWSTGRIDAILRALDSIHAESTPLSATIESHLPDIRDGWAQVRADPSGFLRMGFASPEWLDRLAGMARPPRRCPRGSGQSRSPRGGRLAPSRRSKRQPLLPRRACRLRRLEHGMPRRSIVRRRGMASEPGP